MARLWRAAREACSTLWSCHRGGLARGAVAVIIVAMAFFLAVNAWRDTALGKAQRVAVGAATLDLFVRPQDYQADLDAGVYRQIVAQGQQAQAAANHADQATVLCYFPPQTQNVSWDAQIITFRFRVNYAGSVAGVRVDEELKPRGLVWVVVGLASRREDSNPANDCR